MEPLVRPLPFADEVDDPHEELLDRVFFALSDPVRRAILKRLGDAPLLVSELAAPFDISLQAVSRHVQVLVQAGLVLQERIEALEAEQVRLHAQLEDPDLFRRDPAAFQTIMERLTALETALPAAYVRWEELEQRQTK